MKAILEKVMKTPQEDWGEIFLNINFIISTAQENGVSKEKQNKDFIKWYKSLMKCLENQASKKGPLDQYRIDDILKIRTY